MKTNIANMKDNVASATLIGALLIALVGGVINSASAAAATRHEVKATAGVTQHMETIVVTARR